MTYCKQCLEKQLKIDELKEEIVSLKAKLRYQERTAKEGFFGSSTSSSKLPVKSNTPTENRRNRSGGKTGHKGHGRPSISRKDADRVETLRVGNTCPDRGCALEEKGTGAGIVIHCQPVKIKKMLYLLERKRCPKCRGIINARAPGVLDKCLYSNHLLSVVAVQHYIYGNTLGQIERQTGVGYSSLIDAMYQLAKRLKEVPKVLIEDYRDSPVKHADETGRRTNGKNGYAWLFCTPDISIFRVLRTRSASVAKEVLGDKALPGILVVNRYNGYNKMPCLIQYCYAHLLRTVRDMEKDFPENAEIKSFVEALARQLAKAISLRTSDTTNQQFERQAAKIKDTTIKITHCRARHPAIQKIQDIFREKADRPYHWADDRNVPADNNLAERELRPLVISRKLSFGSQSDAGAKAREILTTVLHTLNKKTPDVTTAFKFALDKLAGQGDIDIYKAVFAFDSS